MWEAIMQSGKLIIGVLVMFAIFMAALVIMERGGRQRRSRRRQPRPELRVMRAVRCEKQDKAA